MRFGVLVASLWSVSDTYPLHEPGRVGLYQLLSKSHQEPAYISDTSSTIISTNPGETDNLQRSKGSLCQSQARNNQTFLQKHI